jgi:hypothetical protein
MGNIEVGHNLLREHPAAPGEARRDALIMTPAHMDVALGLVRVSTSNGSENRR